MVNTLEAVRNSEIKGLYYASSLAVLGPPECNPERPIKDDAPPLPKTLCGVYKKADERKSAFFGKPAKFNSVSGMNDNNQGEVDCLYQVDSLLWPHTNMETDSTKLINF